MTFDDICRLFATNNYQHHASPENMSESELSYICAVPHVKSGHILALHPSKTSTLHWHPGWGNIPTCIQWSIISFKHKIRIISKCLTFFPRVQQYVICLYHFVSVWFFIPYSSPFLALNKRPITKVAMSKKTSPRPELPQHTSNGECWYLPFFRP